MSDKKRIVIIDDQPEITEIVQEFITTKFDVDIDIAQSGQEGLDLISSNIYNLIISDHHMPGMSGTELLKEVRTQAGPNQHCPFLFLTAMEKEVSIEVSGKYEKVHVLNKVVQIQKLMELIESYLS